MLVEPPVFIFIVQPSVGLQSFFISIPLNFAHFRRLDPPVWGFLFFINALTSEGRTLAIIFSTFSSIKLLPSLNKSQKGGIKWTAAAAGKFNLRYR